MMAKPFQGDDQDDFEAARDSEGNVKQVGLAPSAKLSTFGAAFNMARKAGEKTFMYKGKKYTTEMAKPKPKVDVNKERPLANVEEIGAKAQGEPLTGKDRAAFDKMEKEDLAKERNAKVQRESGSFKKGGAVRSSASRRADGCATRGKTRGKMV